jgi:uncharacterized protein YbjT (DUF2867 family)
VNVLVTGGTGTLGREVVRAADAAGHRAVVMSRKPAPNVVTAPRWATADIVTGEGLPAAVADMDVVIHAASDPRGDPDADEEGTRRLAAAARAAGVRHLVYVSIVGIDRIPSPYYVRKLAAERALAASGVPYSILRATQFHSFIDFLFAKAAAYMPLVMPLPAGYFVQSVGLEDVAARLLRAIDEGPNRLLPDFGGPERLTAREAARMWQEARGVRKPLLPFPRFNAVSRAFRRGYNTLPADTPAENRGSLSWRGWLERPIATRPY